MPIGDEVGEGASLKSGWELKFEDSHWAAVTSGTVVIVLSTFIYGFFSQADTSIATDFSKAFSLEADLGQCSSRFSAMIMSQIVYSLVICLLLFSFAFRVVADAVRNIEYRKELLTLAVAPLFCVLVLFALGTASDHGFWLSSIGRRLLTYRIRFHDACQASQKTDFIRLYVTSIWLSAFTWLMMTMLLLIWRKILLQHDYDELPQDPKLRREVLMIRAKFGRSGNFKLPQVSGRRSILLIISATGLVVAICLYRLYAGLVELGAL